MVYMSDPVILLCKGNEGEAMHINLGTTGRRVETGNSAQNYHWLEDLFKGFNFVF